MAIIGLVITLVFEKRKSQQAIELGNQLKEDMGFIEVEDPTRVYLRPLHSEGDSHWEYRIYLPPGHGMDFEITMGDNSDPEYRSVEGGPSSGQFKLTVYEAVDLVNPNRTPLQCFVVGVVDKHTEPNSITRHGIRWPKSHSVTYQGALGRYENKSHHTSLCHGEVKSFGVDDEIPLLMVFDQSESAASVPQDQRDLISIKLKRKAK